MRCQHDAFLRMIFANPDDDTPRLVYADFLQEFGDEARHARAEFIRFQIWGENPDVEPAQREEWQRLAAERLRAFGHLWIDPVDGGVAGRPAPEGVTSWQFRRGFIESVAVISERFPVAVKPIFARHPVRELQIERLTGADSANAIADSRLLRRVETIRLRRAEFQERGLGDAGLIRLLGSPHLDQLRTLDIDGQRLTDAAAGPLSRLPELPRLRVLRLWQHRFDPRWSGQIGTDELPMILFVPPFANLSCLMLENLPLGQKAVDLLDGLTQRGIRAVAFRRCDLGDEGVVGLCQSESFGNLRELDLTQNRLSVLACEALASSTATASLRQLALSSNPIGDEGAAVLVRPAWALRSCTLRNARLGDASLKTLSRASSLSPLRQIDMCGNQVGLPGLRSLCQSDLLTDLQSVDLRRNRLFGKRASQARALARGRFELRV